MSFFLLPATWLLIVIFGVSLWVRGTTKEAVTGLVCYALSFALSNAYTLAVGYDMAVPVWQGSLLLILLMYGIVGKLWWPMLVGLAGLGVYLFGIENRRAFELLVMLLIATSTWLIYRNVEFRNPVGKMVWAVVLVAEGWAAIEYASCQFVSQPGVSFLVENWGVTVSKYSCGRAFGDFAPHVAPVLTTLLLFWIGVRWNFRRIR